MSVKKHEHHNVHFLEPEDTFGKDNEIILEATPDGESISVHLGFLQIGHRYKISVELPRTMCKAGLATDTDLVVREQIPCKVQSLNCKITGISKTQDGYVVDMELLAYKEKLLKEKVYLESSDQSSNINLVLLARVLGKGKGTPLLKNGVHCIGVELDDESEASDWQGFK